MVKRRKFLTLAGAGLLARPTLNIVDRTQSGPVTLLTAPLELIGGWGGSPLPAAARVITRMREVALADVRLLSDQQPDRLRVDNHPSGPPAIWLHTDPPKTAWIVVDIGSRDWCKLAYQFGHELGHVLCNSWGPLAKPTPPSQWFEEALAEAFSIRGLGLLAAAWRANPPFPGDAPFAEFIRQYRQDLIDDYRKAPSPMTDVATWFRTRRRELEDGLPEPEGPAVLAILAELDRDKALAEELGAVNRWPQRSAVRIEEYLTLWLTSCHEIGAAGRLPDRLRALLQLV